MATISTPVTECDLDDGEQLDAGLDPVRFAIDGAQYEIHLCERRELELRGKLAPYVEHARRVSRPTRRKRDREYPQRVREWAGKTGRYPDLQQRGRIPASVIRDYEARRR